MGAYRHLRNARSLDEILNGPDEYGLLSDVTPAKAKPRGSEPPEVARFREICAFRREHGREPALDGNQDEKRLAARLATYRDRPDLAARVTPYDIFGLLSGATARVPEPDASSGSPQSAPPAQEPQSLDDILSADDPLGLLDDISPDIFTLRHVTPPKAGRKEAEEIGRRQPCTDFDRFADLFKTLDRQTKRRPRRGLSLEKPLLEHIRPGEAFILNGQFCYVDREVPGSTGYQRGPQVLPRVRVIFDNGTEARLLTLTLAKALNLHKEANKHIKINKITENRRPFGVIYILETQSDAPALADWKSRRQLTKVGVTEQRVEERLQNAELSTTYLCAPVQLSYTVDCSALNVKNYEKLIHDFLAPRRLNVQLVNNATGKSYRPREWFTVSPETALEVAKRIVDGSIVDYRLDPIQGVVVKR